MPPRAVRQSVRALKARRHNLPAPQRTLIGRENDVATVRALLMRAPGRLVTLTGTGGCGKTQLALRVATDLIDAFPDGVWFVDLASVHAADLVAYSVATALGRGGRAGQAIEDALVEYLADRDVLLVLDNCEHLIDACASLAERLLSECSRIHLLATSRERLRIAGETAWRVPSLASPDPFVTLAPARLLEYPAVQLFVERAQALDRDFVVGPESASLVAALCGRLEGLPLALELAACRLPALSLQEILERLDRSLHLLVGGNRTAPTRQRTLHAALDWSHGLLLADEQAVLRRLAVFAGGWTMEAAEAVCADSAVAAADVLDLLARLVDKSLVVAFERDGRSRYRLLEPIRQFAWQQLVGSGETEAVRQRHATFFLGYTEGLRREEREGRARRGAIVDALRGEYPNLQVALQWALDAEQPELGLRLARTLQFVWRFRLLPAEEGALWIERLLRLPGADAPTPARAVALLTRAWVSWRLDRDAVDALYAEALALARRLGDPWILFVALSDRGLIAMHRGDYRTARACWEEGLPGTQVSGDRAAEAILLSNLGRVAILDRDYAAGRARCQEVLRLGQELRDDWTIGLALESLRMAAQSLGDLTEARALAAECLRLFHGAPFPTGNALRALGQIDIAEGHYQSAREHLGRALVMGHDGALPSVEAGVVDTLAGLAAHLGQPEMAVRLSAAADAAWAALGEEDFPFNRDLRDRWLTPLKQTLRAEDTGRWWAEGQSLSLRDAIAVAEMALPQLPSGALLPRSDQPVGPLTPRQREVVVLVGQGLSNRQIAERLVITERAAAAHVERILDKLGVGTRAQIAVWASEHGMLTPHAN